MDIKRILTYFDTLQKNNNKEWYTANIEEYKICRNSFETGINKALVALTDFDKELSHVQLKNCLYRFHRDTRFSADKSPYKNHFGAYINAKGKKALRGGYYIHLERGNCLLAVGGYWLPTNILTACRQEIMGNIDGWLEIVENKDFVSLFGRATKGKWEETDKGFGINALKTAPSGFDKDYPYIEYLRLKDYCAWTKVDEDFFYRDNWIEEMLKVFSIGKPMMDFINNVVDDYE